MFGLWVLGADARPATSATPCFGLGNGHRARQPCNILCMSSLCILGVVVGRASHAPTPNAHWLDI